MATSDVPPRLRFAFGKRSARAALLDKPPRRSAMPSEPHLPARRVLAQVPRPQPRIPKGEAPVGPVAPVVVHDADNLSRGVLDTDFAGGAYLAYTDGAFRRFDRTHWTTLSEAELGRIVLKHIGHEGARRQRTPSLIRDVISTLRHATASAAPSATADARPIINVDQRHCSDVVYDPKATCPRFDCALADIFSASSDPAALIELWHELFGYLLQPIRRRPLIIVLAGRGRDGKSALAETLVRLLGRGQVTAMPVEDLTGSRFILGDLAESRVFLDADMTAGVLLPDGALKKLSEGTTITAERKFRDPVTFTMRAVPLLLTNTTPRLADRSNGFRRRLLVMPAERQFTEAEVDYGLFAEIHATELSGALNRALEGLQRVIQRGWKFDPPEAVTAATEAWWAEATGVSSEVAEPVCSPAKGSKRSRVTPMPLTQATSIGAREVTPIGGETGTDVSVSIELPATGKACAVHVQVGRTSVGVRVTGTPSLIDQPSDRR